MNAPTIPPVSPLLEAGPKVVLAFSAEKDGFLRVEVLARGGQVPVFQRGESPWSTSTRRRPAKGRDMTGYDHPLVGKVALLKSGGPAMTIFRMRRFSGAPAGTQVVEAEWFDTSGHLQRDAFDLRELVLLDTTTNP